MPLKYHIPWIGRLYRQRDIARSERGLIPARIQEMIPAHAPPQDWGKEVFLRGLPEKCHILDVGCGNDSPFYTKQILPNCHYVGIDVGEYNQNATNLADTYIITSSSEFSCKIDEFKNNFDALISSHNLEHCDDLNATLCAMARALKRGGKAFISFPCADSVAFPSRHGTLNYHDDSTHKNMPPDITDVVCTLASQNMKIVYLSTRYQPPIRWLIGLQSEYKSAKEDRLGPETWAFWGFETVIWAEKK